MTKPAADDRFANVQCVVADPLRFKRQLHIGRKAYKLLRAKDQLYSVWDTVGVAGGAAAVAKSSLIATTFFAPTGIMAWLGLATAATPIGWVVAAAVVSGSAYYGVSRLMQNAEDGYVDTIPRYITTPLDVLAVSLFDFIGRLAVGVARVDGQVAERTLAAISDHFMEDWGYHPDFVASALKLLLQEEASIPLVSIAQPLATFQVENPDCNAEAMQKTLMAFLSDVIAADGVITPSEQAALDQVQAVFEEQRRLSLARLSREAQEAVRTAGDAAQEVMRHTGDAVRESINKMQTGLARVRRRNQ